jgi:uncharacterized linocin/CFP29 family protein
MPDDVARLPWTDEQWAAVQRVVQEAASKARVASSFLPLVGPLPPGQATVPALVMKPTPIAKEERERGEAANRLVIDDGETLRLTTIACEVYLTTQQAEDPDLSSAKQMLGRAADLIGRLEDAIVFNSQPAAGQAPTTLVPDICMVQGGQTNDGLLTAPGASSQSLAKVKGAVEGESLVSGVAAAIQTLEGSGQYAPFACVLGHGLYLAAVAPTPSMVLPSDRIVHLLDGGPLRRSSVVPPGQGVVVALAGSPVDLVVASDVHVKYVQLSLEPSYVLRVSERFVLRIKQPDAICGLA